MLTDNINGTDFLFSNSNRFNFGKIVSYNVAPKINRENKVIKHIVLLKYKENATKSQAYEAVKAFVNLKKKFQLFRILNGD